MCFASKCLFSLQRHQNLKTILDDEKQAIIDLENQIQSTIDSRHETTIPTMKELAMIVHQIHRTMEASKTLREAQISQQKREAATRLFDNIKEQYKIQDDKTEN